MNETLNAIPNTIIVLKYADIVGKFKTTNLKKDIKTINYNALSTVRKYKEIIPISEPSNENNGYYVLSHDGAVSLKAWENTNKSLSIKLQKELEERIENSEITYEAIEKFIEYVLD